MKVKLWGSAKFIYDSFISMQPQIKLVPAYIESDSIHNFAYSMT